MGSQEAVGDEAVGKYIKMYHGPLPKKTAAALAAVTRIASGAVMEASAALAAETEAARVDAA